MKIILVSGGFDPIHSGHIEYFKAARALGDSLIVALNSDNWLSHKKGKYFMPFYERKTIIENLSFVDSVIDFEDDGMGSAANAIKKVKSNYPGDTIIFANGGDRNKDNIPEMAIEGVEFQFGVGGEDKKNSSSWILKKWQYYNEARVWGEFYNLFEEDHVKVKELIVQPHKGMSFQRHFMRHEIWFVSRGACKVNHSNRNYEDKISTQLNRFDRFYVNQGHWHQITNPFNEPCHIIEIQYGDACIEDDIERLEYYEK